jgi:hypothetical protein
MVEFVDMMQKARLHGQNTDGDPVRDLRLPGLLPDGGEQNGQDIPRAQVSQGSDGWRSSIAQNHQSPRQFNHPSHHVSLPPRIPQHANPLSWGHRGLIRSHSSLPLSFMSPCPPSSLPSYHNTKRSGVQAIAITYERSAAAFEKSKEIFELVSKACESPDCTRSDQERLVSIMRERMVRQLDFLAASQAKKSSEFQERRWSTEPQGQGFRTAAKDIRFLIENNSIDSTRVMFLISKENLSESKPAEIIASENDDYEKRALLMRQCADQTAQSFGIPLNSELDRFLESADQQYMPTLDPEAHGQEDTQQDVQREQVHRCVLVPQVNIGPQRTLGAPEPLSEPIIIKEGVTSTGTFDRRSNTWNDFTPRYDGVPILPWVGNDYAIPNGDGVIPDALEAFNDSGELHLRDNHGGNKSLSSTLGVEGDQMLGGETQNKGVSAGPSNDKMGSQYVVGDGEESTSPSCFCGDACQLVNMGKVGAYFGCKDSKCEARIPVPKSNSLSDTLRPMSINEDSGTWFKINSDLNGNPPKQGKRKQDMPLSDDKEAQPAVINPKKIARRKSHETEVATSNEKRPSVDTTQKPNQPRRPSLQEMIDDELALIPLERQCKKRAGDGKLCLVPLKDNAGGICPKHKGRCRYMPRKAQKASRRAAGGSGVSTSDTSPHGGAAAPVESPRELTRDGIDGRRMESQKLLASVMAKGYVNGLSLLRRDFDMLSANAIARDFTCSSNYQHSKWSNLKEELLSQAKVVESNPPLHFSVLTNSKDIGTLPQSVWNDLESRDPTKVHYVERDEAPFGLLARSEIEAGQAIVELVGETISTCEAKRRVQEYASKITAGKDILLKNIIGDSRGALAQAHKMLFQIDDNTVLDATRAGSSARFLNHSTEPNCSFKIVRDPAGIVHYILVADTRITQGDELTFSLSCMKA